ncbi:hypothetical protein K8Z61_02940 [Nocardioides sp. TRM66260-LWL]|uniref:NADH-ubiquinone oxidoreductase-F iron-sulfur binding region domain-containing protein n=1 Tax=Nocardioides sp. TRM66260-LWL TaxID=2874478 RepID=UPI001CC577B1|nr:NADH-ubiquinone oxidoreductase-F iron-sulfur binding region domain-containing protein [Nocardioides sp. TRM66260-LWL]MBZ5733442.1 hypothetical protein [Nocardioides sp. TRM66260-LWL]
MSTDTAARRDRLVQGAVTSPLEVTEDLDVRPGPALLAAHLPDLAAHRRRHGMPAVLDVDGLAALVSAAGMRGRGGAGFPFARKLAAAAAGGRRPVVVVNASEGEPASAKDAALVATAPHLVLDGAAVAARALGAREVHVVLPGDRPRTRALLAAAVAERVATEPRGGLLDGSRLRWQTHIAEPRFVAGQAQAVLELMAGRPNLPVTAWQPEAMAGHRGRPTLLSNAETWAHVGLLACEGLPATLLRGTAEEPGTTLVTVVAPGVRTAVHEVEHGAALRDLLPAHVLGGSVLLGGFHGTWLTADAAADAVLSAARLRAAGTPIGAGVVIAPGPRACLLGLTERITAYLADQSAGRCGPCVNGLPALADAVAGLRRGQPDAAERVARLCGLLPGRGACAHPDGTARLVASLLRAAPGEIAAHARGRCEASVRGAA